MANAKKIKTTKPTYFVNPSDKGQHLGFFAKPSSGIFYVQTKNFCFKAKVQGNFRTKTYSGVDFTSFYPTKISDATIVKKDEILHLQENSKNIGSSSEAALFSFYIWDTEDCDVLDVKTLKDLQLGDIFIENDEMFMIVKPTTENPDVFIVVETKTGSMQLKGFEQTKELNFFRMRNFFG